MPFIQRWIGSISHQLNTAIKPYMNNPSIPCSERGESLQRVKRIFTLFKKVSLNAEIPEGLALVQEAETRFATVHDAAMRFLSNEGHVRLVVEYTDMEATKKASEYLYLLHNVETEDGGREYSSLESIFLCSEPLCHAQTELEASAAPYIMNGFLML